MTDKEKLHQILSSLWKNDDSVGKTYYNQALQDVQIAIDTLQEEPKKCIEKTNEERKRDLSLWTLEDFENNFFDIIKPYKNSRNYKNLCVRLLLWRSELWRWIHWKLITAEND